MFIIHAWYQKIKTKVNLLFTLYFNFYLKVNIMCAIITQTNVLFLGKWSNNKNIHCFAGKKVNIRFTFCMAGRIYGEKGNEVR